MKVNGFNYKSHFDYYDPFITMKLVLKILNTENCFDKMSQIKRNKNMHILNGNRLKDHTIEFGHINKGPSNFTNKVNCVQNLINKHYPDVLSIVEANIKKSDLFSPCEFPNYRIEYCLMSDQIDIATNILLFRDNITYKRRLI